MWDSAASAFPVRSQLPFELVCPSGKRYAVTGDQLGVSGQKGRRPIAETNDGIHIVARPKWAFKLHWAVENVLSYWTTP
jgi:hypothetical protein